MATSHRKPTGVKLLPYSMLSSAFHLCCYACPTSEISWLIPSDFYIGGSAVICVPENPRDHQAEGGEAFEGRFTAPQGIAFCRNVVNVD